MSAEHRSFGVTDREIVSTVLDPKAIDFNQIGEVIGKHGDQIARGVSIERYRALSGETRTKYPFAAAYHTAYVMGVGEQETLAPMLCAIAVRRAARRFDLGAVERVLVIAAEHDLLGGPAPAQAAELLRRALALDEFVSRTPVGRADVCVRAAADVTFEHGRGLGRRSSAPGCASAGRKRLDTVCRETGRGAAWLAR